jgi:hypothetical protein
MVESEGIACDFARVPGYVLPAGADPVQGDSRDPRSNTSQAGRQQAGGSEFWILGVSAGGRSNPWMKPHIQCNINY